MLLDDIVDTILSTWNPTSTHVQIYDFIKYIIRYNLYLKYSFKRIRQSSDSFLDLIYGDLIFLSNQAKICALQESEFGRVLLSKISCFEEYFWFVFKVLLKNFYEMFRLDSTKLIFCRLQA